MHKKKQVGVMFQNISKSMIIYYGVGTWSLISDICGYFIYKYLWGGKRNRFENYY